MPKEGLHRYPDTTTRRRTGGEIFDILPWCFLGFWLQTMFGWKYLERRIGVIVVDRGPIICCWIDRPS